MPIATFTHSSVAGLRRKLAVACTALAGLAAATLSDPAAARMTSCQIKHSYCSERCIINNNGQGKIIACISRTCDRQHPGCGPESLGDGKGKGKGKAGLVASPKQSVGDGMAAPKRQPGPVVAGSAPRQPHQPGGNPRAR